ncbi:MAG: Gfo/Idh/MocA family oxidoreductase [Anaerolineae bacterium]|nr:Gfo/Idh/MocA family oxidoreductase [Anaerolineae bacterium]
MIPLGLFGTGVMGQRHIKGMARLRGVGLQRIELVGVCDLLPANAERAADLAEQLLGQRPRVFPNFAAMQHAVSAITLTTMPNTHADLGVEALAAGKHVLCEKPIALTVKQGLRLIEAARAANRKLSVAENYRRDPMNRLGKALLDAGVIGQPFLMTQSSSGSGENVVITPWRHLKRSCGIAVDMGVHYTDILEYFLGPITGVAGLNAVVDKQRKGSDGALHPADAEDLTAGTAQFASGAIGHFLLSMAGRGEGHFARMIYGTGGTLKLPPDRSGQAVQLVQRVNGQDVAVPEGDLLALVPNFKLDEATAALFGGQRLSSYRMDWADIDAGLIAIEYDDLANAILNDSEPEVNGEQGNRSLALMYGFLESQRLGRFVSADELVSGRVSGYQDELMG